jgi:hypothetical protein
MTAKTPTATGRPTADQPTTQARPKGTHTQIRTLPRHVDSTLLACRTSVGGRVSRISCRITGATLPTHCGGLESQEPISCNSADHDRKWEGRDQPDRHNPWGRDKQRDEGEPTMRGAWAGTGAKGRARWQRIT